MMNEIRAKRLSRDAFSRYGEAILVAQDQKPDSAGEGWECWYPLGQARTEKDMSFGIVKCQPVLSELRFMERHQDRAEYLIALDHPIIQTVGFSDPQHPGLPDPSQTEAFVIYPGQIVKVNPGIWHAAAMSLGTEAAPYLFILGGPREDSVNPDSGLVRFATETNIHVVVPPDLR